MNNPIAKKVPMENMYPLIAEMLEEGGSVTFTVVGWSMQPMMYNGVDQATLQKAKLPLKKYDVPFYRLDNGKFILHRIIKIHKNGTFECRGDNCVRSENPVRPDQVIGVLTAFTHKGKSCSINDFSYKLYVCRIVFVRRMKRLSFRLIHNRLTHFVKHRIFGKLRNCK